MAYLESRGWIFERRLTVLARASFTLHSAQCLCAGICSQKLGKRDQDWRSDLYSILVGPVGSETPLTDSLRLIV